MFVFTFHEDPVERTPLRRGVWAFTCIGLGILAGLHLPAVAPLAWLVAAGVAVVLATVARGRAVLPALGLALTLLAAGWTHARIHRGPTDWLPDVVGTDGRSIVTLTGMVKDGPAIQTEMPRFRDRGEPPRRTQRWTLATRSVISGGASIPASGEVSVILTGPPAPVAAGMLVRVTGWWRPPGPARNPAERDARLWAAQDGLAGSLGVEDARLVVPEPGAGSLGAWIARRLAWLRGGFASLLESPDGSDESAGSSAGRATLAALLIGRYDPAVRDVSDAWSRLGLVHALSISGFHIVVFAGTVLWAMRLTGDRGWLEPALVALLVIVYLLIVPARAPMVRSGLMVLAMLAAESLGRRYDGLNTLAWIGCLLLAWRPLDLLDPGFQLSFGVTAALVWLGTPLHQHLFRRGVRGRTREVDRGAVGWVADVASKGLTTGLLAWGVSAPAVLYHAGVLSLLTPITGLIVALPVNIVLITGYVSLAVRLVLRVFGLDADWAMTPLRWLADRLVAFTMRLDAIPGDVWHAPIISGWWAAAATAIAVWWLNPRWRGGIRRWVATGACLVWLAAWLMALERPNAGALVRADALSLSGGACVLVRAGEAAVLVDCGSRARERAEWLIPRALRQLGATHVSAVVLTHPSPDHWSALPSLIDRFGIRDVIVADGFLGAARARSDGPAAELLRLLDARGVAVRGVVDGASLAWPGAAARFHLVEAHPEQLGLTFSIEGSQETLWVGTAAAGPPSGAGALVFTTQPRALPGSAGEPVIVPGPCERSSNAWSLQDQGAAMVTIPRSGGARVEPFAASE